MKEMSVLEILSYGFFYGSAFAAILFTLVFYSVNKGKANVYFMLYSLFTAIYFISIDGLGTAFIWKNDLAFNSLVNEVSSFLTVSFLVLYSSRFLHLELIIARIDLLSYSFISFRAIICIIQCLNLFPSANLAFFVDVSMMALILYYGAKCIINGYKPALFFMLGFTGLIIGFLFTESFEIAYYHSKTLDRTVGIGFHVGFILQLLLQVLGLFVRYKVRDVEEGEQNLESERAKSWNMLMDILDYIPHQIFLKDRKHRLVLVNKRVADIYNLTREQIIGKTDFNLFNNDVAQQYYDDEEAIFKAGKPVKNPEMLHKGKDGNIRIFDSLKQPFYISDIKEDGLLGIEIEITDAKILEKQLIDQNHEIEAQKVQITELLQNVTDSIKTAKMIQEAIMPPERALAEYFHDYFVLYMPKDIVSGDFYWFKYPANRQKILFATVDCTGHGVAGAFISLIANNLLNKIVDSNVYATPAEILNKLNDEVMFALNQGPNSQGGSHDGMDITLCVLDMQTMELQFAGACSQLCLVRNGELILYKTDHFSIGYLNNKRRLFSNFSITLQNDDMLYIYSDGFAGQFGGEDGQQKFKYNRLRDLLFKISNMPMNDQKNLLKNTLEEWKGNQEQTDDVMVMGFRFSL
jgi:PAS domain S-box-containing protein